MTFPCSLLLFSLVVCGQESALLEAACDAEVAGGVCMEDQKWSLGAVVMGHFLHARSEDAMVTAILQQPPRAYSTKGVLVTKADGQWRRVGEAVIALEFSDCRKLVFGDRRELLVCGSERAVRAVWGEMEIQNLVVAEEGEEIDRFRFLGGGRIVVMVRGTVAAPGKGVRRRKVEFLFDGRGIRGVGRR